MDRLNDLRRFYAILTTLKHRLGGKRLLAACNGRMHWPQRGVYFFFEPGEMRTRSGKGPRVVRAGTHALTSGSRTTLWKRLSQHQGVRKSGGGNHREMLMHDLGLGQGDANTLTHFVLKSDGERSAKEQNLFTGDVLDEIYSGPKAGLRPIHDRLMEAIQAFGEFEIAPKKGYVSLRRKKQFAMIGPATNTRVEVGINLKTLGPHPRLSEQPPGGMCNFKVKVTQADEVDDELIAWVRQAFDNAV